MAITTDWQAELRGLTIGRNTDYPGIGDIDGVGLVRLEVADVDLLGDGAALTGDRTPARTVQIPVLVVGDTQAEIGQNYGVLASAWRKATTDLELTVRLPGQPETTLGLFGRPIEVPAAPAGMKPGVLRTRALFRAGDPQFYGAEVDSGVQASAASPYTVPAADLGSAGADTDRVTLTIAGNGGTPTITNDETGGTLAFATTLAGGQSYVVDLHTRTVTKSGVNRDQDVDATSTWFALLGGQDNDVSFSGCASLRIQHRPAYHTPWG